MFFFWLKKFLKEIASLIFPCDKIFSFLTLTTIRNQSFDSLLAKRSLSSFRNIFGYFIAKWNQNFREWKKLEKIVSVNKFKERRKQRENLVFMPSFETARNLDVKFFSMLAIFSFHTRLLRALFFFVFWKNFLKNFKKVF